MTRVRSKGPQTAETDGSGEATSNCRALYPAPLTPTQHLIQAELAARWRISERTLERRRYLRQGPPYVKIGAHVVYRLVDIEAYENAHLRGGAR